ncbi:MAG: tyrosine-type recombinase/integrase [Syntrophorhabdus sp.]
MESILEKYETYLRSEKCMAERSVSDYMMIAGDLSKAIDVLNGPSYRQINDTIRHLKEKNNWSQGTVYKYSICVRHFFKWLQREEYRPDNPYPFSEWRKPRPHTPKFLTQAQFDSIVDDPFLSHQELTLLWTLWDTGARIGEIEQLTQENIDPKNGIVNIPYEISKGNYSYRNIPVSENSTKCLNTQFGFAHRRGHEKAIFLNPRNEPMTRSGMQKIIYAIGLRSSPLRPAMRLSPHQFRHSFGIRMLEKGVPQIIVQKWLGHQSLTMTSHYVNLTVESSIRIFRNHCGVEHGDATEYAKISSLQTGILQKAP